MLEHSTKPKAVKAIERQIKQSKTQPQINPNHHQGRGTQARLNTAAEKHFFSAKYSQ